MYRENITTFVALEPATLSDKLVVPAGRLVDSSGDSLLCSCISVVKKVLFKFETTRCKVNANLLIRPLAASDPPAVAAIGELELPDPFHAPLGSEVPMG